MSTNRIKMFTNRIKIDALLQVVNYGIGGHYEPHYDFARVSISQAQITQPDLMDLVHCEGDLAEQTGGCRNQQAKFIDILLGDVCY